MGALFILLVVLLVFAPKVLAGVAVVMSFIPILALFIFMGGLVWIIFTQDNSVSKLGNPDKKK